MNRLELLICSGELTQVSFTVVDMNLPQQPLMHVNKGFETLTRYSAEEIVGKNCRFLQGPLSSPAAVENIRNSIQRRESFRQDLVNYRKDGTPFWNRLVLLPVELEKNLYYIGFQHDVTDRKPKIEKGMASDPKGERSVSSEEITDRINNPLTIAFFNIEKLVVKADAEAVERVRSAMKAVSAYVLTID